MAAAFEGLESTDLAMEVLRQYETLKKLGLMISSNSAFTNWKDVAGKLKKSVEEIEGYYARKTEPGDPGYSVLKDWIVCEGGTFSQLCKVFEDLNLQSCLDELKKDIQEFAAKKQTERIGVPDTDSLDEKYRKPSSQNNNSPPSESRAHSLSETAVVKPTSQCCDAFLPNTLEKKDTNDGIRAELTKNCNIPSTSEMSFVPCALEESAREGTSQLVSPPPFFRYVSCPADVELSSPPPSPPPRRRRSFKARLFQRSKSVGCKRDSATKGINFWRLIGKRASSKKSKNPDQSVTQATAAHAHMEPAEKPVSNLSPVTNLSNNHSRAGAYESSPAVNDSNSGQTYNRPDAVAIGETKDPGNEVARDRADSEDSQKHHISRPEREAGYSSEESECPPSPLAVDSSKKIFIISHEDNRLAAESLHKFFKEQDCECHLYQLEYSLMAEITPFKYMTTNLENADFVLICPSSKLRKVLNMVEGTCDSLLCDDMDNSLRYALNLMVNEMGFRGRNYKGKYMPVLFDPKDKNYVPFSLLGAMKYAWPRDCNKMITVMNGEQRLR